MPATRSATRSANATQLPPAPTAVSETENPPASQSRNKRKLATATQSTQSSTKKRKESSKVVTKDNSKSEDVPAPVPPVPAAEGEVEHNALVPAVLTFSLEDAKSHLVSVDPRFEDIFARMECTPFENLERVHPFRALTMSILGQQVSWMAARSIMHKFRRLYDPSLPEKPGDDDDSKSVTSSFPTPAQVAKTDLATLRTAGLSQRKAEYVQGLAERFADGRLSTEKLMNADDESLAEMLIDVRGIGMWTVNMFAIFSLRRPDILPVGDLGVQRGVVQWFLSLHSPSHRYGISPEKASSKKKNKKKTAGDDSHSDELPSLQTAEKDNTADVAETSNQEETASLPPAFTPSIKKVLEKVPENSKPPKLPEGLNVSALKSRLSGKKIKGALLTPKEMEDLTESWKPYRSIAVYYMWSLAELDADE